MGPRDLERVRCALATENIAFNLPNERAVLEGNDTTLTVDAMGSLLALVGTLLHARVIADPSVMTTSDIPGLLVCIDQREDTSHEHARIVLADPMERSRLA